MACRHLAFTFYLEKLPPLRSKTDSRMLSGDENVVLRVTRQAADVVAALLEAPPVADSFQTAARRPDKQHGTFQVRTFWHLLRL